MDPALKAPSLALLIPTLGRPEAVIETAIALFAQMGPEDSLHIVDQNRPWLTWPESLAMDTRLHIHLQNQPSLTLARNLALAQACSLPWTDYAIFLDDDISFAPDFLDNLRQSLLARPDTILTGKIEQGDKPAQAQGIGQVDYDSGKIVTDFTNTPDEPLPFFAGGMVALPVHRLRKILSPSGLAHAYSTRFRGASLGEEIDLALRLKSRGLSIYGSSRWKMVHLKLPMGGCRSENFQARFNLHHLFNHAYFWARHGRLGAFLIFMKCSKGFLEYHTRLYPEYPSRGHSPLKVLQGLSAIVQGLGLGLCSRPFLKK